MSREEGPLSDREAQNESRKIEARQRRLQREDIGSLERNAGFRRWFGKYAETTLMLDLRTSNGGDLQHFMGRRSLLLEMLAEFEVEVPGFYERVLATRRSLSNELRQEPQNEE